MYTFGALKNIQNIKSDFGSMLKGFTRKENQHQIGKISDDEWNKIYNEYTPIVERTLNDIRECYGAHVNEINEMNQIYLRQSQGSEVERIHRGEQGISEKFIRDEIYIFSQHYNKIVHKIREHFPTIEVEEYQQQ